MNPYILEIWKGELQVRNKKGFTLIELIIVGALLITVLSVIFSPITFSFKNFNIQNEKTYIISNARQAMNYLTREIRKAEKVEVDNNNLIIDSGIYRIENRILYKDDNRVMDGIDELNVDKNNKLINIEIIIRSKGSKDYKLSSNINLR